MIQLDQSIRESSFLSSHFYFLIILSLTFRWLFIPYIQAELDAYVDRINNTRKRADRNKILPHGPPKEIFEHPERYGALDFKVSNHCTIPIQYLIILRSKSNPRRYNMYEIDLLRPMIQSSSLSLPRLQHMLAKSMLS